MQMIAFHSLPLAFQWPAIGPKASRANYRYGLLGFPELYLHVIGIDIPTHLQPFLSPSRAGE